MASWDEKQERFRVAPYPASTPSPERALGGEGTFAVADVGSNAARFELVELRAGAFERVMRERVPLELGASVFDSGLVDERAVDELVETLRRWRALCDHAGARARWLTTSALREAHNAAHVLARVRGEARVQLEVLSGDQEALLIGKGALSCAPGRAPALVLDVGGGSTEVIFGRSGAIERAASLRLGSGRFSGVRKASLLTTGAQAIDELLQRELPRDFGEGAIAALVTSGTNRAVLRWGAAHTDGCVNVPSLRAIGSALAALTARERLAAFGDRADKVLPSMVILTRVVQRLGPLVLVPCRRGLRHGALMELARAPGAFLDAGSAQA